jgi:Zn-dependent protease/CBS domain-containing protein
MRWSWKIANILGIGVYVHATFWLLILFILYSSWSQGNTIAQAAAGVVFVLSIFACVVLHEFGHALTARRFGIRTRDITLLPIGGVARLERMPRDPKQELWVALAGPAVNIGIAALLLFVSTAIGLRFDWRTFSWSGSNLLTGLIEINLGLALFNLIPAFPMDGGRVLRALLAIRMEYPRATWIAARTGQALAFVLGVIGLFGNPFLIFIALFVWFGAEQEAAATQAQSSLGGIPVQCAMLKNFQTISPDESVTKAAAYLLAGWQKEFPVVWGSQVLGILTREDVIQAIQERGPETLVRDAMQRNVDSVGSDETLEGIVGRLRGGKSRALPVLHHGQLVGILTMENIAEFLRISTAVAHRSPK